MHLSKWMISGLAAVSLTIGAADPAVAKDKKSHKIGGAATHQVKPGKKHKAIPPGQIKRYTRGAKLPGNVHYKPISDLSKWKLKPLKHGEKYIRVDDNILRVSDALIVLSVIGLVSELTN